MNEVFIIQLEECDTPDLLDPYDAAVAQGYQGTKEQWLASLFDAMKVERQLADFEQRIAKLEQTVGEPSQLTEFLTNQEENQNENEET